MLQDLRKAMQGNLKSHRSTRQIPSPAAFTIHFDPITLDNGKKAVSISFINLEAEQSFLGSVYKLQDFSDLANLIPHMVWMADARGRIQFTNNFWTTYTGQSDECLLTQSYSQAVHPEDRQQLRDLWSKAVASNSLYEAEIRLKNKEGHYRWFVSRASPVKDRQGNVLRWVGVSMDVHDYKEMAQTLREQQSYLRALADNVPAFILSLDEHGHIRFANRFHQKMGYKPNELIGQPFYTVYTLKDPSYAQVLHQGIEKALQGTEERVQGRIFDTNVETIEVETVIYPYKSSFLQPMGVILLSFDVTLHKKEQESLKNQKQHLQEANQDFDILFHRMAQDIYGPLNSLEGLFQLLKADTALTKGQKPVLKHMETSLQRFRSTLVHITSWVAASAGNSVEWEQTKLPELMEELLWEIQESINQTGTTIETVYNRQVFDVSGRNLRSILYNMISNSIKYRKIGTSPHLKISFFENAAYECCIEVQDNGMGIKRSELNKVTQAFEKIDPGSDGLGLGMYVVKRIVERYEGTIEITSTEGEGTTFCVFLCPRKA